MVSLSFSPSAASTSSNTWRAGAKVSASALPMPTAWLPWPGKTKAIVIVYLSGAREIPPSRPCQGTRSSNKATTPSGYSQLTRAHLPKGIVYNLAPDGPICPDHRGRTRPSARGSRVPTAAFDAEPRNPARQTAKTAPGASQRYCHRLSDAGGGDTCGTIGRADPDHGQSAPPFLIRLAFPRGLHIRPVFRSTPAGG